jgi:TatD DNase family protein
VIDSHCHLADTAFVDDLDAVVARSQTAGLTHALCILAAEDPAELQRAEQLATLWPELRFAVGLHPHQAGVYEARESDVARTVRDVIVGLPQVRAVGEIGLDYHYQFAPRPVQHAVFRAQIRLARELELPIVIHTREAEDDTFRILDEERAAEVPVVLHCFTGDRAMAHRALEAGYDLSLAGIVTFPRAAELQEVVRLVPLDRLLIETDSPFLAPVPHRGTRNEPAYVVKVVETIAGLKGTTREAVAAATSANFVRIFAP